MHSSNTNKMETEFPRSGIFPPVECFVNSKLVTLMFLSPRIVLALVLHVSSTKASAFKDHLFDLILVEWFVDKRSTMSTPPFVWSYITYTCGFFHWSLVTLLLSCIVVMRMTFFLPGFFLSVYDTSITFFFLVVDIKDWLFFSIVDEFQLVLYSLSIMSHGTHNHELFLQSPFCQRHGSKVPVKQNIATLDAAVIKKLGVSVRTSYIVFSSITFGILGITIIW